MRREALARANRLLRESSGGKPVDANQLEELKRQSELLRLRRGLQPKRRSFVPAIAVTLVLSLILLAGAVKVSAPEAILDMAVSKLDIAVHDAHTPTAALLGHSRWATCMRWKEKTVPTECAAKPRALSSESPIRHLRVDARNGTEGRLVPLGLGDAEPYGLGSVTYASGEDGSIIFLGRELRIPIAVTKGDIDMYDGASGEEALYSSIDRDRSESLYCSVSSELIEVLTDTIEFAPSRLVGPVMARGLTFGDQQLVLTHASLQVAETAQEPEPAEVAERIARSTLSTIQWANIEFPSVPTANRRLSEGDRLDLDPADGPAAVHIRPGNNALRVIVKGRFSRIRGAGADLRPSYLDYVWNSSFLRLIFAASGGVLAAVLAVLRWWGLRT